MKASYKSVIDGDLESIANVILKCFQGEYTKMYITKMRLRDKVN